MALGGHGATAARLTPDQKAGSSNLSAVMLSEDHLRCLSTEIGTTKRKLALFEQWLPAS